MSIDNRIGSQTLKGPIQNMMLDLNALRAKQDADLTALYEVIPAITITTTSGANDSAPTSEPGAQPGAGSVAPRAKREYIARSKEDERSRLLKTRLMLYNQAIALHYQIALLPSGFEEMKISDALLLSDLQFILRDLWEEERALTETLEDRTISERNQFLLMFYRRMVFMVAEAAAKFC